MVFSSMYITVLDYIHPYCLLVTLSIIPVSVLFLSAPLFFPCHSQSNIYLNLDSMYERKHEIFVFLPPLLFQYPSFSHWLPFSQD